MGKGEYSLTAGGLLKPPKPQDDDQKPLQEPQPAVVIIAKKPKKAKRRGQSAVLARLQASASASPCLTVLVTAAVALLIASAVLTLLALLAHGGFADLPHFGSPVKTELYTKEKTLNINGDKQKLRNMLDDVKEKQPKQPKKNDDVKQKAGVPLSQALAGRPRSAISATPDHCLHMRRGRCNHSVVHDTKVGTSAIVFPRYKRCLLFYPVSRAVVPVCPRDYPWGMDRDMGILPAVSPEGAPAAMAQFTATYRLVQRCLATQPLAPAEVAAQGKAISAACHNYITYRVMSVLAIYRSKRFRLGREAHQMNLMGEDTASLSPFVNEETAAELDAAAKLGDGVATPDGFAWAAPGWRDAGIIQTAVVDQQGDEVDVAFLPVKDAMP